MQLATPTMLLYPATVHFQSCTLNVNKIEVLLCFRKLICAFSLTCFKVLMCKISDKYDTFSLSYSNLFRGPLFSGHSVESTQTSRPPLPKFLQGGQSAIFGLIAQQRWTLCRCGLKTSRYRHHFKLPV